MFFYGIFKYVDNLVLVCDFEKFFWDLWLSIVSILLLIMFIYVYKFRKLFLNIYLKCLFIYNY